jgi:hypothetical protein
MATKSNSRGASDVPADASQISRELAPALAAADNAVAERVLNLKWVHQARLSRLSRTAASLKAQYGADDPGVNAAEAAVAAANLDAARISMLHQQLTTVDPQVTPNGWALHGRVYDAQLRPVSGFTVFLVDATKTYQQAYGFAYTDETGYFLLNFAGPDSESHKKTPTVAQTAGETQLFIGIANTKALPVFLSRTTFQPVVGEATYQNITLPDGDHAIGDPPSEIRNFAFPVRKTKKKT